MDIIVNWALDHQYLLIAFATAFAGTWVRISHDSEVLEIKKARIIGYYTTGIFVGYLFFELLRILDWQKATGLVCAISGLISGPIIKWIINDVTNFLPDIIKRWAYKKFDVELKEEEKTIKTKKNDLS